MRSIATYIKAIEDIKPSHTISYTATLREAISHMATLHVSTLCVADAQGTLLGQVQAADLLEN
jgi:CBS-domain-containing membrane protein